MDSINQFLNNNSTTRAYWLNMSVNANNISTLTTQRITSNNDATTFKNSLIKEEKNNGLVEKFYDFCKNKTGLGIGSKKVAKHIKDYENRKIKENDVITLISKYKSSQENAEQNLGDFTAGLAGLTGYLGMSGVANVLKAQMQVKALPNWLTESGLEYASHRYKNISKGFNNVLKSNALTKAIIISSAMLLAGLTKLLTLKINRIGSKEFKVENKKNLDKKEFKNLNKEIKHDRRKQNSKNFLTGAIDGLLAPVAAIAGGIVGIPAYIIVTSVTRYFSSKNDNKDKTFKSYGENLKNNAVINFLFAVALAVPAAKGVKYNKVLSKNLEKVVTKLKDVKLQPPNLQSNKTAYEEIEDIMLKSENIKNIISDYSLNTSDKIQKLTDENIFAVKFLQISKGNKKYGISSELLENCPPTRTLEEAQQEINKLLNSDKYQISKSLGVGTIAETYLAQDQSGKEVCIKMLKRGIDAAKIQKDKEAFINIATNATPKDQLTKSQQYLVKSIENLAEGISKEVDFEHEMKAAQKLKKSTKQADVVTPIEAKPGIYIMERAPGISLDTLVKYYDAERILKFLENKPDTEGPLKLEDNLDVDFDYSKYREKRIEEQKQLIEHLKSKSPDFSAFDLSASEINTLLRKYIDIIVEQFTKVDKNGKTIHADIHPGNIFINLEALKTQKGKLFTLIDTGNTIDVSREQAIASRNITSIIKKGNVKDITKCVIEDAILPTNLNKEEAYKLVEQDLKKAFFDNKTKIETMNSDELFKLTDNILRQHDIIPNNTQLNLNKAKTSAYNSLENLAETFFDKKYGDVDDYNKAKQAAVLSSAIKDLALFVEKWKRSNTIQETKNLFHMTKKEIISQIKKPNMLKTNSEDYLTYKFKQNIKIEKKEGEIPKFDF